MTMAKLGPIDQIGYLTVDLDAAVARWTRQLGVGPWTLFRNVALNGKYREQPTRVTIDVALSYQGAVQIELIQPTNEAPSPYRGSDGAVLQGIHHVAWVVDDIDRELARFAEVGLTPAFTASNPATRVAYLAPEGGAGVYYELIEGTGMRAMIDEGAAGAARWDGSTPVIEIDLSAPA